MKSFITLFERLPRGEEKFLEWKMIKTIFLTVRDDCLTFILGKKKSLDFSCALLRALKLPKHDKIGSHFPS